MDSNRVYELNGGLLLNKKKFLAILLVFVFVISVSSAVAADTADVGQDLEASDDEITPVETTKH